MDRHEALQFLHDRHANIVDAPHGDGVPLELFHLEFFEFQMHVCNLLDRRREGAVRRCFASVEQLLAHGSREVMYAVYGDFVQPHLVFHEEFDWARKQMRPLLAELCSMARKWAEEAARPPSPTESGDRA
jgi:hypothetical protein